VEKAFQAQRQLLYIASQSKKPDTTSRNFMELLKPTQEALEQVVDFREKNRSHGLFNHLSTVSEGISAVGWVAVVRRQ
jgi:adenylyl cyclase-associated protein